MGAIDPLQVFEKEESYSSQIISKHQSLSAQNIRNIAYALIFDNDDNSVAGKDRIVASGNDRPSAANNSRYQNIFLELKLAQRLVGDARILPYVELKSLDPTVHELVKRLYLTSAGRLERTRVLNKDV